MRFYVIVRKTMCILSEDLVTKISCKTSATFEAGSGYSFNANKFTPSCVEFEMAKSYVCSVLCCQQQNYSGDLDC